MRSDVVAEAYLISAMINNQTIANDYLHKLNLSDFYKIENQHIFNVLKSLHFRNEELLLDKIAYQLIQEAKIACPMSLLLDIQSLNGHMCDIEFYFHIVKENSLARSLTSLAQNLELRSKSKENAYDLQVEFQEKISSFGKIDSRGFISMRETWDNFEDNMPYHDFLKKRMIDFAEGKDCFDGIRTGYKRLDSLIGGFANGTNNIIGARSSSGKTTFLCNLIINITNNYPEKKIGFFSLEMPRNRIVQKLIAAYLNINPKNLEDGKITLQDYERVVEFEKKPTHPNLLFFDYSGVSVQEVKSVIRNEIRKSELNIVFIDYLTRIQSDRKYSSKHLEIDYVSKSLQDAALEFKIPIVSLAQLNRQFAMRADKRPVMSDLRESGSIEEDSDLILLMHRPAQHQAGVKDNTEIIVAKNRLFGDLGKVELEFNNGLLTELPTLQELMPYEVTSPIENTRRNYHDF